LIVRLVGSCGEKNPVVFSVTNEVLDPILTDVVKGNRDKVVGWLRNEHGSWGFLAGQAVSSVRKQAGRDLNDMERRLVWSRMWWWLEQVRSSVQ
tara:strand:- start:396 stop:677 length:282 start_codon:yes stop_codon:yes gene_type:complete